MLHRLLALACGLKRFKTSLPPASPAGRKDCLSSLAQRAAGWCKVSSNHPHKIVLIKSTTVCPLEHELRRLRLCERKNVRNSLLPVRFMCRPFFALSRGWRYESGDSGLPRYTYTYTYIHYITLHYITLHYITLHYITLHYITLHYITLHYITLHYITLHYITLHYITLHYITLHYITLHYIHTSMHACMHAYIHTYIHNIT